jgi:hypothetical protein
VGGFHPQTPGCSCPQTDTKALACKLAKAAWHVMHDDAPYDPQRVFGGGKE